MKMKKFGKLLGGILLCAALLTATAMTAFALPPVEGPQYDGIDISRWQGGSIDFARVKEAGYGIVYIRAGGGGDYTDPDFERNYTEAKAAGMQIGFYYYVDAENETEAGEQAAHFASLVRDKEPDCRPAMEFVIDGLDNATVNRLALAFLQRAEELSGFAMCVYTNAYNAGNVYSGAITAYPLWIAEYDVERPSDIGTWTAWAGWRVRQRARRRRQRGPGHLYERHLPARNAARVVRRVRSRNGTHCPRLDSRRTDRLHTGSLLPGPPQKDGLIRRSLDRGPRESGGP